MTESRLYPSRPFLAASVAVIRGDRVLVAARVRPPMQALHTLPGGMVEPGETLAEAALRELAEEVGVEAELAGLVAPVEVIERDEAGRVRHHAVVMAHAARWTAGEPQAGAEAVDVRWVTEGELAGLDHTPGLPGIVRAAFALVRGADRPETAR
jgi:ADP-ribose pyrophosphatase YjhB (NUDIX family)